MRKVLKFFMLIILIIIFGVGCSKKISDEYIFNARQYFIMGMEKNLLNDYKGAKKDLDEAIKLNPKYEWAYYQRAKIKLEKKDYKGAKKDLIKLINLNPKDHISVDLELGEIEIILGNYNEAIKLLDKYIKLYSNDAEAYFYRGMAKLHMKNDEAAQEDFAMALKLNTERYRVLDERKKEFEKKIEELKKSK